MEENTPILHQTIQAIAGVIYFVPLLLILISKKLQTSFFVIFAAYWTWGALVNLMVWTSFPDNDVFISNVETCYNLIDGPLLLLVLYFTTAFKVIKQYLMRVLIVYVAVLLIMVLSVGLNLVVERVITASGVVIVLTAVCWIIYYTHFKSGRPYSQLSSRQFIYYALLFGGGCSIITFILTYVYEPGAAQGADVFLIYHVSVIFIIVIASYGFITYRKDEPFKLRRVNVSKEDAEFKFL